MVASLQVDSSMAPRYPCKFPFEIVGYHLVEPECHSVELTFPDVEPAAAVVVAPAEPPSVVVPAFFVFVEIVQAKTVVVHQDLTMNYQYYYSMLSVVAADSVVTSELDSPLQTFVLMTQTRHHAVAQAGYCTSAAADFADLDRMIVDHRLYTAVVGHYSYYLAVDAAAVVAVDICYFAPAYLDFVAVLPLVAAVEEIVAPMPSLPELHTP